MTLARVFPRRSKATPTDALAFWDEPGMFLPDIDEVHVSVAFTYDMPRAEELARAWECIAPVKIGGPACGEPSGDFVPGRYLKPGYVITSRGCPNKCWFCSVWRREGHEIRELPITEGWNVLDDNLLACSEKHIRAVFAMLARQKKRAEFTGGLEAARLKPWHVEELYKLKPAQLFFAYDTADDYPPLVEAAMLLYQGGFRKGDHRLRCYVLIGYPKDTLRAAETRLHETVRAGLLPMAMLWRGEDGTYDKDWRRLQRLWARPAATSALVNEARL